MLPFSTSFVFSMAPPTSDLTLIGHGFVFLFTPHVGISDATSAQHLGFLNFSNNGDSNNHIFGAEFDVFRNEELNDIDDNHVGINVNSLSSMSAYEAWFWSDDNGINVEFKKLKLNNGKNYQVWIDYSDNSINVTMALAGSKRPKTPLLNYTFNLSPSFIKKVEDEVSRLEKFKSGKMREIVLKKRLELEDICRRTHMVTEELSAMKHSTEAVESGLMDPMYLLEQIESKIVKVKKKAGSRKDILDKVEKWMAAYEEESWLEEYNRDENRYNAGRGAHLMLRRADKARVALSKTPVHW